MCILEKKVIILGGSFTSINNYSWSKLGGEASVQLYKNSLYSKFMANLLFIEAFTNVKTSFIYQDDVAELLSKLLREKDNQLGWKNSIYL